MHDGSGARTTRTVYSFFLGVLLALFVGLGIAVVHPGPAEPSPPPALAVAQETRELSPAERQEWLAHETRREAWAEESARHSRDVGLAALVASVALVAVGLLAERRRPVLANGALLGGLFTLLYSITQSLAAGDTLVSFVVVTAALALVLVLGYRRFVDRPSDSALRQDARPGTGRGPRPARR